MSEHTEVHTVGIINLSPDSFNASTPKPRDAIKLAHRMFEQGVSFIDVGAMATNPNSGPIHVEDEWLRFQPVLSALLPEFPGRISVDSPRSLIHRRAAKFGHPFIINDVSGFNNPRMQEVARELQLPVINSHLPFSAGNKPWQAHKGPLLDKVDIVFKQLMRRTQRLEQLGVAASAITLDPGLGFGKLPLINWKLLESLGRLPAGYPIMVGFSHKRFLGTHLGTGGPLSKDQDYNERTRHTSQRNRLAAEMAIKAAAGRRLYLRVHEPEWYSDLIS